MSRRSLFLSILIGILGLVIIYYSLQKKEAPIVAVHPKGLSFAGAESCRSCHANINTSNEQTAHFKTSSRATGPSIKGSFKEGENVYHFNQFDKIVMSATDSGYYQTGYRGDNKVGEQQMDIAIGSGTKGQTYLSWTGNKLVQLPVSYYTNDGRWASSPGNPADRFVINRPITAQCMNCHTTHIDVFHKMNEAPAFDPTSMMLGISCERCHGPAASHVTSNQSSKTKLTGVVNPKLLNRRQQLDLCAQCHSAKRTMLTPPFYFLPGDSLMEDPMSLSVTDTSRSAEVHGNQYDLLAASKCFLNSADMTCSSCHNPHKSERGNLAEFSQRCQSCHTSGESHAKICKMTSVMGEKINTNCIDCHMPERQSKKITFRTDKSTSLTSERARTHFITIYPDQARKILSAMKKL